MRILAIILLAVVLGIGIGAGTAASRVRLHPRKTAETPAEASKADASHMPKVSLDEEAFDFGMQDVGKKGHHSFKVTNIGTAPLILEPGTSSCRCTVSEIQKKELAPDESTDVVVSWKPHLNDTAFQQTVTVNTNDPRQSEIQFTVKGQITQAVYAEPNEIAFGHLADSQERTAEVRILCNLPGKPLKVSDLQLSDTGRAKYFKVEQLPLADEELHKSKDAKSGVLLRVTVKPGLPHGQFEQTILMNTNVEAAPEVTVLVTVSVSSEVLVTGPDWTSENGVLSIGAVDGRQGAERKLMLVVEGPHYKEVTFKPTVIEPDFLKVSVGKPIQNDARQITLTPFTIQIPKRDTPTSHMGSEQGKLGKIVLETTHPQVHELQIRVRFAVEGEGKIKSAQQ